ncbi:MAG: hypothetical protein WEC81_01185 [Patescibacteria group bacterium]
MDDMNTPAAEGTEEEKKEGMPAEGGDAMPMGGEEKKEEGDNAGM